jgi:hypothetical protein
MEGLKLKKFVAEQQEASARGEEREDPRMDEKRRTVSGVIGSTECWSGRGRGRREDRGKITRGIGGRDLIGERARK